jgi:hypothetical protein
VRRRAGNIRDAVVDSYEGTLRLQSQQRGFRLWSNTQNNVNKLLKTARSLQVDLQYTNKLEWPCVSAKYM